MAAGPELSVVLPAYNEEAWLAGAVDELAAGLRERGQHFEIIVVENGSSDRTVQVANELAAAHDEVIALSDPMPDYGRALRRGLLAASGTYVVNFDVDYYDLAFLERAVGMLRDTGAAIVVGSKRGEGAQDTRGLPRRAVTATFSTILKVGFGLGVSDTHGMKAMARELVRPYAEQCVLGTDLFDTELVLRAERAGLRVAELPVRVEERRPARSAIVRRIARTLVGLVRLRRAVGPRPA
jgi:glycosyltransferase involved in cell wall biosynthesis